jgi:Icc-related predicted phosphoesterase
VTQCFFASDLHGKPDRYKKLFSVIERDKPAAVFVGGDILPHGFGVVRQHHGHGGDFLTDFLLGNLAALRDRLGDAYPQIHVILGNDDPRSEEAAIVEAAENGLLKYAHNKRHEIDDYTVFGYAYVPPTPFSLKDWERYDVSRFVDPGCVPPNEGIRTFPVSEEEQNWATIEKDLEVLAGDVDLARALFLFHSPPYETDLDRAALDGMTVDHAPLDVHVGSIAIKRFIEQRQPLVTLHGHVHESTRLTGRWKQSIGRTVALNGAHDGSELALIRFDLRDPNTATRELL